jgi:hypothetical protein
MLLLQPLRQIHQLLRYLLALLISLFFMLFRCRPPYLFYYRIRLPRVDIQPWLERALLHDLGEFLELVLVFGLLGEFLAVVEVF